MKKLICFLLIFAAANSFSQSPGSGSNSTVGPGPATPDAGSTDTSVMGGGTPGNKGAFNLDINEPDQKRLNQMKQKQEVKKSKLENNTDQNPEADTI